MNPSSHPSNVAVVGGGLGGLAAAATLAARGHRVTLFDKNPWLGGKAAQRGDTRKQQRVVAWSDDQHGSKGDTFDARANPAQPERPAVYAQFPRTEKLSGLPLQKPTGFGERDQFGG